VSAPSDTELYLRGIRTLVASWEVYARGSEGAAIVRAAGVAAGVFPTEPQRGVYNNAVFERGLGACARAAALDAVDAAYASAGIARFAAWVHEGDAAMRVDVEARGYTLQESTRAMGLALRDLRVPRPELDLAPAEWWDYLSYLEHFGLPSGLLAHVDPRDFHLLLARLDGETVTAGLALDLDGDCGIYNVGTVPRARRRGLGTAMTALQLHEARHRGCRTASLQASPMAERLYTRAGFRDLGRFLEYVPGMTA
jgi:ribosomal protein S18 acetylase RimI-like enzyme